MAVGGNRSPSSGHLLGVTSESAPARELRLERMFSAHVAELWQFAVRRVGRQAADDVVCETFLAAWRRLEDVPVGRERAWLYGTARFVISNEARSKRRRDALTERLGSLVAPHSAGADVAEDVVERDAVYRALAALPEADREVLRLSEWDQLSGPEAAEVLGCSAATYRLRLHRARRRFSISIQAARPADDQLDNPTLLMERGATP